MLKGPYSVRGPFFSGFSITNPPLKLSRVPSFSLLIWWHTEQETPSAAGLPAGSLESMGKLLNTSPGEPFSWASKRVIGMWQMEHSSSMAFLDSAWSMLSRRTLACQYGSRDEFG